MKKLSAKHILNKCSQCFCLRLNETDNFFCSLHHDEPGRGVNALLDLKRTHRNVNIEDPKCSGRSEVVDLETVINEISAQARHFGRGLVGFSTGCLYQFNMPLVDKLKVYLRAGATVLELSFATLNDLLAFEPTAADISKFRKFTKITIHAPWKGIRYFDGSNAANLVVNKIMALNDIFYVSGVVFHPDIIDNFDALELTPLPVLIENMDINKEFGISVEEIAMIKVRYNFGFVLDIQHAYEHDSSLALAREMTQVMGDRIRHLHVSGQNSSSRHAPVFEADNKQEICNLLKIMPSVPVVLEGVLSGDVSVISKQEIAYVTEHGDPLSK